MGAGMGKRFVNLVESRAVFAVSVLVVLLLLIPKIVDSVASGLPSSYWFTPGAVIVSDAREGECPGLAFAREIKRPFHAGWTVTIMREEADGDWATHRTFTGENDYRPGNDLPDDLNLCWWGWTDTETLGLEPGRYRVHTLWRMTPRTGIIRDIRRTSNVFTVTRD
jgi:hypothetical protein